MSIALEATRDKPIGFWMLDTASPFADRSGYSRAASIVSGTPDRHAALVSGASYAPIVANTRRMQFDFPTFMRTKESKAFTVEAVVRPLTGASPHQIFGHLDNYDGLVFDGTNIYFSTKYATSGEARATYLLDPLRSVHVVGVHTKAKNSLYIDGALVDEVDITDAQQADVYAVDGATMYSGITTGTGRIAINAVGTYNYPLDSEAIARHAFAAKDVPDPSAVAESFGGLRIGVGVQMGTAFLESVYETEEDWQEGSLVGTRVEEDALVYNGTPDNPVPGTWLTVFPIDFSGATSIYGVQIAWSGVGAIVETSLTGSTWTAAVNGRMISNVTPGYNPTNKDLMVRVTFDGTVENAALDNLTITGYSNASSVESGRTITRIGAIHERLDYPVIDYQSGWGIELLGGALTISPSDDNNSLTGPSTIEIWARNLQATSGVLLDAQDAGNSGYAYFGASTTNSYAANGALYINGDRVTPPFVWRINEWTLIHVVVSNTNPTTIHIGENYQGNLRGRYEIGSIVFYDTQLTAATVAEVYKTYVGRPAARLGDTSSIRMSQAGDGALIYAADWSIQSAG